MRTFVSILIAIIVGCGILVGVLCCTSCWYDDADYSSGGLSNYDYSASTSAGNSSGGSSNYDYSASTSAGNSSGGSSSYNSNVTTTPVEIAGVEYGFIEVGSITDDSQLSIENATKPISFDVINEYYFLISFTITSRESNDGTSLLETNISLGNAGFIDGNVYTSTSGESPVKTTIKDPNTGKDKINLSVSNKISSKKDGSKNILIVVKMATLKYGESNMSVSFSGNSLKLSGDTSGFGKLLIIEQVKLTTPELSFNENSLELQWANIEHVDYYKVYVDGQLLTGDDGKAITYNVDEYNSAGAMVSWDLSNYISGIHRVKIQAFSNSTNFIVSDYSNEVVVSI